MNYKEFMIYQMKSFGKENRCLSSKYRLIKINILWADYKNIKNNNKIQY